MTPDLAHKTGYCGPQRPKSDQKLIGRSVGMYDFIYIYFYLINIVYYTPQEMNDYAALGACD